MSHRLNRHLSGPRAGRGDAGLSALRPAVGSVMPGRRSFWWDDHGGTAVLMAFGLVMTLSFAALGVDYARAIAMEQALSSAADAAALGPRHACPMAMPRAR